MANEELNTIPTLHLTDAALKTVREVRDAEPGGESLALWVEVRGYRDGDYAYDLYFQALTDAEADDWTTLDQGVPVVVPKASVAKLVGSVLDVYGEGADEGLVIKNPNHPPTSQPSPDIDGPLGDLVGDTSERITQVLDRQVNPSIALHGGHAELVAFEEGLAYLRLSGGCAGCGMASVTLSQGIEVAITRSIPEVTRVVDVTDHASGSNPYYEPSKK